MKSVALHNLGCKVNSYEVDIMQQNLQKNGFEIVEFEQKSDIYIINTCSVTNMADRKSRQMLHRAKKCNPNALVVAVGCYVQADAFHIAQDESIDLLVGNNLKKNIAEILNRYKKETIEMPEEASEEEKNFLRKTLNNTTIVDVKKVEFEDDTMETTAEHARAYIKIQDGCNRFCSYCIIPYTRGRVRSRKPESILKEIRDLTKKGYREFVLTGIHISSYGLDFEEKNPQKYLLELIKNIDAIEGVARIRIGSFEPMILSEEFVEGLASCPKLCPHFHISLQSGCDATLKRMNRRYTTEEYRQRVAVLRKHFPHCAITTDVIVGFPGETEEEFKETEKFLEEIAFAEMHIFKYSRRRGTKADVMPDQIAEQVKTKRSDCLLTLAERLTMEYRQSFLGEEVSVLLEEEKLLEGQKYWIGYTPEYIKVALLSQGDARNTQIEARLEKILEDGLVKGKRMV